jgi:hypothetical protein
LVLIRALDRKVLIGKECPDTKTDLATYYLSTFFNPTNLNVIFIQIVIKMRLTGHGTITDIAIVVAIMIGVAAVATFIVRALIYG